MMHRLLKIHWDAIPGVLAVVTAIVPNLEGVPQATATGMAGSPAAPSR